MPLCFFITISRHPPFFASPLLKTDGEIYAISLTPVVKMLQAPAFKNTSYIFAAYRSPKITSCDFYTACASCLSHINHRHRDTHTISTKTFFIRAAVFLRVSNDTSFIRLKKWVDTLYKKV